MKMLGLGRGLTGAHNKPYARRVAGLVLWLRADLPSTVHTDAHGVYQWDDLSGLLHHATQSTDSYKPGYTSGLSVDFTAADVHHLLANAVAAYCAGEHQPITVVAVYECTVDGSVQTLFAFGSSTDTDPLHLVYADYSTNALLGLRRDDVGTLAAIVSLTPTSSGILDDVFATPWTRTITVNGTPAAQNQDVGVLTTNTFSIGAIVRATASVGLNGKIKEFLVYNRGLIAPELTFLRTVLNAKWLVY